MTFANPLSPDASAKLERLLSHIDSHSLSDAQLNELQRVLLASEFAAEQFAKYGDIAVFWQELSEPFSEAALTLDDFMPLDEPAVMAKMRIWRNRWQCKLICWQVLGQLDTKELILRATLIAECAIDFASRWAYQTLIAQFGLPQTCKYSKQPQQLVVFAMGKLGARELNLSSDIDLIFAYSKEGETHNEQGPTLAHKSFFIRQGQLIIKLLDRVTVDGFVYRTDMRLRPYGQSGPLACNFPFMENYYREQGREWERYAMIKAKTISGHPATRHYIEQQLAPFVFRKYVDYRVMESLREMKQMIAKEVARQGKQRNIKLGAGGIREIEFIVQALQLIQGGRDVSLQPPNIFNAFLVIEQNNYLPEKVVHELRDAYCWLRDCEHAIQMYRDEQTQILPNDEASLLRIASVLNCQDLADFEAQLAMHQQNVIEHFANFIALDEQPKVKTHSWSMAAWLEEQPHAELGDEVFKAIIEFKHSSDVARMSEAGRELLDRYMPLLLQELAPLVDASLAWQRLMPILDSILRRSVYLSLLLENPIATRQMVKLATLSPWFAQQLAEKPFLLDELRDQNKLYALPSRIQIADELRQIMLRIPEDDVEQQMEALRHFKHSRVLRAAACEITGILPLMKISDYLTYVAEIILEEVLNCAWKLLTYKHGTPIKEAGVPCSPDFCILAYGKLGGLELSYGSDLDIVFVHDAHPQLSTDGAKPIENNVFFTRLGQKIIHYMSVNTTSGVLYEIDMQLRPSGNSGLLVSTVSGFNNYQAKSAWTWEHQALVRARFVAGSQITRAKVEAIRQQTLMMARDEQELKTKVRDMRQKMRDHLGSPTQEVENNRLFHIKQDQGGIVDLEFMVQYGVLKLAHKFSQLTQYSDNIRLIELLAVSDFFSESEALQLKEAYIALRSTIHSKILHNASNKLTEADEITRLQPHRDNITSIWQRLMT